MGRLISAIKEGAKITIILAGMLVAYKLLLELLIYFLL